MTSLLLPLLLLQQAPLEAKLQQRLAEIHQAGGFPGATAAVRLKDGTMIAIAVGEQEAFKAKMKPTDRMLAGSIGKTFFAAAILQLARENKVSLDENIVKWPGVKDWFAKVPNAKDLTLRHLVTHSSGIPEHVESKEFVDAIFQDPNKMWKPEEIVAFVAGKQPLFEAGKGWSYADTNFIVAAFAFEQESGKNLYEEIDRRFLKPLKLTDTIPSTSSTLPGLVQGHSMPNSPFRHEGPMIKDGKMLFNPQMEWAGGGFVSSSPNLAEWAYQLYSGKLLPPDMQKEMLTGVPAKTGRDHQYGLGVQIRPTAYGVSWGHGGWFPGYLSETEYFPEKEVAIAVQINTDDFAKTKMSTHRLVLELAKIVFGEATY